MGYLGLLACMIDYFWVMAAISSLANGTASHPKLQGTITNGQCYFLLLYSILTEYTQIITDLCLNYWRNSYNVLRKEGLVRKNNLREYGWPFFFFFSLISDLHSLCKLHLDSQKNKSDKYRVLTLLGSLQLRGYCTPGQFLDCFCIFLKNYNTLVTNKICFL